MYVSGHDEIMDEIISEYFPNYFDNLLYKNVTKEKLYNGLIYPDLPCGKYKVKNNHIIMSRQTTCPLTKLYKSMSIQYKFKEIYESHRGSVSFMHSMSTNPKLKVKDIVKTILTNIISFAFLAIYDIDYFKTTMPSPNIFWIGIILHIIQDSYSQSHTIRRNDRKIIFMKEQETHTSKLTRIITNLKTSMDKTALKNKLLMHFPHLKTHIIQNLNRLHKAHTFFLFNKQRVTVANKLLHVNVRPSIDTKKYDIINFQYYNNQEPLYHRKYDLMVQVRKYPKMFERLKKECLYVLVSYKNCLERIKQDPTQHKTITMDFLKNLLNYLSDNTYRISRKNWDKYTGAQYIYTSLIP